MHKKINIKSNFTQLKPKYKKKKQRVNQQLSTSSESTRPRRAERLGFPLVAFEGEVFCCGICIGACVESSMEASVVSSAGPVPVHCTSHRHNINNFKEKNISVEDVECQTDQHTRQNNKPSLSEGKI
jgi:hypothetical protein